MAGATDFIGRVRERVETAEERQRRETARHPVAARYTVLVTRDGAGAFLLGIGVTEAPAQVAAE